MLPLADSMTNKIAFNPQDRFVVALGNKIVVTTQDGSVFGHDVVGHRSGDAFQFTGPRAAFNPQDRFVVTIGNQLIVTTQNGDVFGHDVTGRDIGPAFKFAGDKAAFNPQDRFVVTIGNQLIVTTQNGDVFGHDVAGRNIGPAFRFTGSKAAFNPQDRFVVTVGNMMLVTTQNGDVFGHDVTGRDIGPGFKLTGSRMAFNPQDRFVVTIGNMMIVMTRNGDAFAADITGRDIGSIFRLNPDSTDKCDPLRSQLRALETELARTRKFDPPEPGVPRGRPVISEQFAAISRRVSSARLALRLCLPPPPPPPPVVPTPLTLTLTKFVCLDQSDDIRLFGLNVEDDEPYALVFAVDLRLTLGAAPVGASNSKMTLVGPLSDVDPEELTAPPNVLWGLSNMPDLVSSADNLIILVAMMENDSSSPDQVRRTLEIAAQAAMAQNLPAFIAKQIPRQELVNRMISGAAGAMGVAKVGIPDPDDNIGAIQELRIFQFELDSFYRTSTPIEKSLVFEGDDAKYVLKFSAFR
jgi:hypothetical protein